MIQCEQFVESLQNIGIEFFAGVPDSLLEHICACITDSLGPEKHIITSNEGAAVALATGYHLATKKVPMVYMQNSGLGNAINPLLSLADRKVYSIPMILMVGWRGEPNVTDEPQHLKQGYVQNDLLKVMEIPYSIIGHESADYDEIVQDLVKQAREQSRPVALVIKKGTFATYNSTKKDNDQMYFTREAAIETIIDGIQVNDILVSTTGKISRELFEVRHKKNMGHQFDFLTVGSMGHCSQIALGVSLQKPDQQVYCLDGDGAFIMHMGSLAINGNCASSNYKHIVFNNGAHDSVGGQPTVGFSIDIPVIAISCGYKAAMKVETPYELKNAISWLAGTDGPVLLEVRVNKGSRNDLGRPTRSTIENKTEFMNNLAF